MQQAHTFGLVLGAVEFVSSGLDSTDAMQPYATRLRSFAWHFGRSHLTSHPGTA
jgi:hypothetical protein